MSGRREAPRYLLSVLSLLEDAGDTPASTDFRSNLELRRLAQAPLQLQLSRSRRIRFVAAAIDGAASRMTKKENRAA